MKLLHLLIGFLAPVAFVAFLGQLGPENEALIPLFVGGWWIVVIVMALKKSGGQGNPPSEP
jgi:hypothetical protein